MTTIPGTAVRSVSEAVGAERLSGGEGRVIDGIRPAAAVAPESTEEVSRVLGAARRDGLGVAPRGGGTRMGLGGPPERYDLSLDTSRLDRVAAHNPADLTATVEAGITLDALRESLEEHGQFLAMDAPRPDLATVGGTLAAGAIGPLKWQFGSPRDLVVGMKVVQANGRVTKSGGRVVKNVSGYDMARLHVGGLGTLGVIVEVSFKLTPLPRRQATLLAAFDDSGPALSAGLAISNGWAAPLAMVTFDAEANRRGGFTGSARGYFLAVRLGGRPRTLDRQIDDCRRSCDRHGAVCLEVVDAAGTPVLWSKIRDLGWMDDDAPEYTARASVPSSRLPGLIAGLETGGPAPAVVAEPGYGSALVHWFADGERDAVSGAVADARVGAVHAGGSLVLERRPMGSRKIDPWGEVGGSLSIMRRMKERYDPARILNPGRFVGGI